jgi:hypothetical protein
MSDQPVTPKPFQFSVLKLLGCVGGLCVLFALVVPAFEPSGEANRRHACTNNLKQIGIALQNYHDVHGCFPAPFSVDANGKPLHSWRVAIEPFMGSSSFGGTFDQALPWDNPKNLQASAPWSHLFQCPSARHPKGSGFTNYVMVVGQSREGSGTKEAIIVVEIADSDINWTEPRDLNFDEMSFKINDKSNPSISSHHAHGALAVFADGSVHFLDEAIEPDELKKLLTKNLEDASGRNEANR